MKKVLTVVIPTYNMEKYLHKCLDSLIVHPQEMELLEILVINDGSKDYSSKIAHEYEQKFPMTFRVIDKENGNYGSCINRGVKEAQGKYIKVLDADDYFETSTLEEFLNFLNHIDVELVISDYCTINTKGKVTFKYTFSFPVKQSFSMERVKERDEIPMHAITYKTECLREIGYKQTEGISYTDVEWCFLPMIAVNQILYFNKNLYCYLIGREGQTMDSNIRIKNFWMLVAVLRQLIEWFSSSLYDKGMAEYYLKGKIRRIASTVYSGYIRNKKVLKEEELIDLDLYIKQSSPLLYAEMDKYLLDKYIPLKFIKAWRMKRTTILSLCIHSQSFINRLRKYWMSLKRIIARNK